MTKREEKAVDLATDTTKQLITLAAGIITFSVTFAGPQAAMSKTLLAAWIAYLLSISAGVVTLMAITGTLAASSQSSNANPLSVVQTQTVYASNIRLFASIQIFALLGGALLTVAFGFTMTNDSNADAKKAAENFLNALSTGRAGSYASDDIKVTSPNSTIVGKNAFNEELTTTWKRYAALQAVIKQVNSADRLAVITGTFAGREQGGEEHLGRFTCILSRDGRTWKVSEFFLETIPGPTVPNLH